MAEAHVTLVGCGGLGSVIALNLVVSGILNIHLVDSDDIELSNLSRQILFTEVDVGKSKVKVLAEQLKARNSQANITYSHEMFDIHNPSIDAKTDFAVLSADQSGIVEAFNRFAVDQQIAYLHTSYINDIACWGPLVVPNATACRDCQKHVGRESCELYKEHAQTIKTINERYQSPSFGPINMLSASLASLDIIRFLGGVGNAHSINRRIGLWSDKLHFQYQDYSKNNACLTCGVKS